MVFKRVVARDANLFEDLDTVVLDRRDTCHLRSSLERASQEQTTEAGFVLEELEVRLGPVLLFESGGFLDRFKFCYDKGIIFVTMRVELSKGLEPLLWLSVVNQPLI